MEVIVPKSEQKIDPRHPESTDPTYARDKAIAEERYKTMEFESETQRADYLRQVDSNPGNMRGLPILYPPLKIRSAMNDVRHAVECKCGGCCIQQDNFICPRCGQQN